MNCKYHKKANFKIKLNPIVIFHNHFKYYNSKLNSKNYNFHMKINYSLMAKQSLPKLFLIM